MPDVNAVNQNDRYSGNTSFVLKSYSPTHLLIQDTGFVANPASNTGNANGNQQSQSQLSESEQNELTSGLAGTENSSNTNTGTVQNTVTNSNNNGQRSLSSTTDQNVRKGVRKFRNSTYCWGTKDKEMEEVLDGIDSSNVMEVMKAWNKYHSKQKGESFMKAFVWDADSEQKETYCRSIAEALLERAEQAGAYDEEMAELFAKIDEELDSWFYISNDISDVFDKIIYKIAEAEADQLAKNAPDEEKANVKAEALKYAKPSKKCNLSLSA